MSRFYGMNVEISGHDPERAEAIKRAAKDLWSFLEGWADILEGVLTAYAEDFLTGGETEEQFAHRLIQAVWRANGSYCDVTVKATYLENLPCEDYLLDKDAYEQWLKGEASPENGSAEEKIA